MYKAAMIGDKDSIYGFAAAGIAIYPSYSRDETLAVLRELTEKGDVAVIFITERLFAQITEEAAKLSDRMIPAIIPVPGVTGNNGIGRRNVSTSIIRAVGSDIS